MITLTRPINYNWTNLPHITQAMDSWPLGWKDKRCSVVWGCIPTAIWWTLLRERNKRAFEGKQRSVEYLIEQIKLQAYSWAKGPTPMFELSSNIIIHKWKDIFSMSDRFLV